MGVSRINYLTGIKAAALAAAILFSNSLLYPQETPDTIVKVTLEECISSALQNNFKYSAAQKQLKAAEAIKKQAESVYWPQISAKGILTTTDENPKFIIPSFVLDVPGISSGPFQIPPMSFNIPEQNITLMNNRNFSAALDIFYPLYTGGKLDAVNAQAQQALEISQIDLRKTELQIIHDAEYYYYALLLSKKLYEIGQQGLEALKSTLDLTQQMYKNGSGSTTKLDYLRIKVITDQAQVFVNELKRNCISSRDALKFHTGIKYNIEPADSEITINSNYLSYFEAVAFSDTNPDLLKLNSALKFYEAKIDEAFSGYLPGIAVNGSYIHNFNSYNGGIVNKYNNSLIMINLGAELPLFNGFKTAAQIQEAEADYKRVEYEKAYAEEGVTLVVKEGLDKLKQYQENINLLKDALLTAEENRELTEKAYRAEMTASSDLIQSQIFEYLTKMNIYKSIFDYNITAADLKKILGIK